MNRYIASLLVLVGIFCVSQHRSQTSGQSPADLSPTWQAVQESLNQGRPQSAIDQLTPIIDAAKTAENHPETIKALTLQIALQSSIQSDQPDLRLRLMRSAIDAAPADMQPAMEAIQARWMWMFFQQHRWQFAQRTTVESDSAADTAKSNSDTADSDSGAAIDDSDMLTWDLQRILRAIDEQFQRSLAQAETLQAIPVEQYREALTIGNVPDLYRPTLYDILVHHALEFYTAGEQAGAQASFAFTLRADSPIFSSLDDFLAWTPDTRDQRNPSLRAIELYQNLLRFHAADSDPSARLDLDLQRLQFGYNNAVGSEKDSRYTAALQRFETAHASHPLSAVALHRLAQLQQQAEDLVAAHRLASIGLARFPDSNGAALCFNLIREIESPASTIGAERVWNAPWPTVDVQYRNLSKVYFRLVPYDFDQFIQSGRWRPEELNDAQITALLQQPTVRAWSADLPATADYQLRTESVPVPQDIAPGSYFLLSSHNEVFGREQNQLGLVEVWVSQLAVVTRNNQGTVLRERNTSNASAANNAQTDENSVLGGLVTDAQSGQPIAGATVQAWRRVNNNDNRMLPLPEIQTDADGLFRIPHQSNRDQLVYLVKHGDQRLASANFHHTYQQARTNATRQQTQFFTDRAIYRPGQTVRFKGICFQTNPEDNLYETLQRQRVNVTFLDANGKEIETQQHLSNEFGSFQGSFTAPRDRLPGQMQIRVQGGPTGQVAIRVEDYKRPRFEVELNAADATARLGGPVQVKGRALAYTGAAVDGAEVSWRVVREVRFPAWWYWRSPWPIHTDSQEIAFGTSPTAADGSFTVDFTALPDANVSADSEARFQYTVYADVTDSAGETRSARRVVNLGYTTLAASLTTPEWIQHNQSTDLQISTASLDGDGQSAAGTVKVYALQQPQQTQRSPLGGHQRIMPRRPRGGMPVGRPGTVPADDSADPNDINQWPLGEVAFESAVKTDASGKQTLAVTLPAGVYRAVLSVRDPFGNEVTAMAPLTVLDPAANRLPIRVPHFVQLKQSSLQPGETLQAVWGSGYDTATAMIEIEHRGQILKRYWTSPQQTQTLIEHPIDESLRGGFTLRITMIRDNRAYLHSQQVSVPWKNKELAIRWERFVSKLQPGQQETWTAVISGPDGERAAAELVATLYDASLDTFAPHQWAQTLGGFYHDYSRLNSQFENDLRFANQFGHGWQPAYRDASWNYTRLGNPLDNLRGFHHSHYFDHWVMQRQMRMRGAPMAGMGGLGMASAAPEAEMRSMSLADAATVPAFSPPEMEYEGRRKNSSLVLEMVDQAESSVGGGDQSTTGGGTDIDLSGVIARRNLHETAFFFPSVVAGEDGTVRLQFTMPEALTRWQFFGFAHDQQLRAGFLSDTAVTSKDLMVQPNAPRFLREGDLVEFTVKVTNQSPTRQTGSVSLTFADARTTDSVDEQLNKVTGQQPFDIAAGQSQTVSWQIRVADGLSLLTYRAVGSTGRLSDGEEGYLPVLPRRILVSESLPLPINGQGTQTFEFSRLLETAGSDSLTHQSLTVQMASNPAWYAVLSLPYLMEYPHQCSEQVFSRLYANALARHIASSDPKIERVFEQWRGTDALDSPLEKNEELRAAILAETPWVRQAESESQARRNVGILFDKNRLDDEIGRALNQLSQQQLEDGRWPWFPGGPANDFITLYVTTGFGRLRHLGVDVDVAPALRALTRLDQWVTEMHQEILNRRPSNPEADHLTPTVAMYLYGRSFFLTDQPIAAEHQPAVDYWIGQAKQYWLDSGSLQSQGHLAIALKRFDQPETASNIMISLKERSVLSDEMGRYWAAGPMSPWWYQAPIETQALLIEAFDEVMNDAEAVEQCKTWMLKQRQTQNWKTTKATADAVYALLLRGTNLLASDKLVEVTLGDRKLQPEKVEAGTGFYEVRIPADQIAASLGQITVVKSDPGIAWGSVHWQYFEDIGNITASGDNPLQLTKQLFVKRNTDAGPVLQPLTGPASVGDELVVRLVLRSDRDLEYVHLRDHRGSGTEPVDVLSSFRWREGLGYYQATRDTATDFFIDYLRKGTYVFEYSTRIQLRGEYQTGMANIQCMYAPEFQSHSQSIGIQVE